MRLMRFSARLLRRRFSLYSRDPTPDEVEEITNRLGGDRSWYRVDLVVQGVVGQAGFSEPHLHGPAGRHLHVKMQARATSV